MSSTNRKLEDRLREVILASPDVVLEDQDVMQALIVAGDRAKGNNVIDLRGAAMERLEDRLDRLEDTHRSVIAAAYDNVAGTNQVHRAVLKLLDPRDFEDFLKTLTTEVAAILNLETVVLVLEATQDGSEPPLDRVEDGLAVAGPGFVRNYLTRGRGGTPRPVTLRGLRAPDPRLYGTKAAKIGSEACLLLNLGEGRLPGLLLMGAQDPQHFDPEQGTDLLNFFAGVFERSMRHWLA